MVFIVFLFPRHQNVVLHILSTLYVDDSKQPPSLSPILFSYKKDFFFLLTAEWYARNVIFYRLQDTYN